MRVFFDTNVLLDVLLTRPGLEVESRELWNTVEADKIEGLVSAVSISTIYYLAYKMSRDRAFAMNCISRILNIFEIAEVNAVVIHQAMASGMSDFEDSIQSHAAEMASVECIVTRNVKDFRGGPVEPIAPGDLIDVLRAIGRL